MLRYRESVSYKQDYIDEVEKENKLLRATIDTLKSDLQDCRNHGSGTGSAPTSTLKERIAGLGALASEINKEVESQDAELRERGISSNFQQMRYLELENGRLIDDVSRLEDRLRMARNRKVASPYTSRDEKDAKIEELTRLTLWLNESVENHFREANHIKSQYGRLLEKKKKLEEMLEEVEKRAKKKGKNSGTTKARRDRTHRKREKATHAQSDSGKETGEKAEKVIDAGKVADIKRREAEVRRYGSLVREREAVETQVRK